MKKKRYVLLLIVLCLLFPAIQSKADLELGGTTGSTWMEYEFEGRAWKYKSHYSARAKGQGTQLLFTYDHDTAEIALQFGYTWYDQEELLFSEMTQMHDTEEVKIQWKSPDLLSYGSSIATFFVGDTRLGKDMERVRMTYNWQEGSE